MININVDEARNLALEATQTLQKQEEFVESAIKGFAKKGLYEASLIIPSNVAINILNQLQGLGYTVSLTDYNTAEQPLSKTIKIGWPIDV